MRFLIDENLPIEFAQLLSAAGYDAVCARDVGLAGSSDEKVWAYCLEHQLTLLTLDSDFSDSRKYPPARGFGIVLLRTSKGIHLTEILRLAITAMQGLDSKSIRGKIVIVGAQRVRIRQR